VPCGAASGIIHIIGVQSPRVCACVVVATSARLASAPVDDDRVLGAEAACDHGGVHRGVSPAVNGHAAPDAPFPPEATLAEKTPRHHRARVHRGDVDSFGQVRTDRDEYRVKAALVALGREVSRPDGSAGHRTPIARCGQLDIQHVNGAAGSSECRSGIIPPGAAPASRMSTSWPRTARW